MNIAVLNNGLCTQIAVFDDIETAETFLNLGVWPGATHVIEMSEGYGIGDTYIDGVWKKGEPPEPEPEPEPEHDPAYEFLLGFMDGCAEYFPPASSTT